MSKPKNITSNEDSIAALCTLTARSDGMIGIKLKASQMFPAGEVTDFETGLKIKILAEPGVQAQYSKGMYKNYPLLSYAGSADRDLIIIPVPYIASGKNEYVLRVYNVSGSDITVPADTVLALVMPTAFRPYHD